MSVSNKIKTESQSALDNMKTEIANELGLSNYEQMDKGKLTARENGYVALEGTTQNANSFMITREITDSKETKWTY